MEQTPVLDLEALQNPLLNHLPILHQLRRLSLFCLFILPRIMRHIDRNHNVRALLFEAQEEQVDGGVFHGFAGGVSGWRRGLDEGQGVDWFVAAWCVSMSW